MKYWKLLLVATLLLAPLHLGCEVDAEAPVDLHVDQAGHEHAVREHHVVPLAGRLVADPGHPPGRVTSCLDAAPLGHSRPREIGLSGSPSIWMTRSSLT